MKPSHKIALALAALAVALLLFFWPRKTAAQPLPEPPQMTAMVTA